MTCAEARDRLLEAALGAAPDPAAHAAECASCGVELARWRRVVELARGDEPAPAGLADRVLDFARVAAALDALPTPVPDPAFVARVVAMASVSAALDALPAPIPGARFTPRVMAAVQADGVAPRTGDSGTIRLRDYARHRVQRAPMWIAAVAAHAAVLLVLASIAVGTWGRTPGPGPVVDVAREQPIDDDDDGGGRIEPIPGEVKPPPIGRIADIPIDPDVEFADEPETTRPPVPPGDPGRVGGPRVGPDFGPGAIEPVASWVAKERRIRTEVLAWMGARTRAETRAAAASAAGSAGWRPAIDRGLEWLRRAQREDGSWDAAAHGGEPEHVVALNALCVLAFAADGHSPGCGSDDAARVRAAAVWLGGQQDEASGRIAPDGPNHLYDHSLALAALAELHALDLAYYWSIRDSSLRKRVRLGVRYLATAQNADGGWGYRPGAASDTSVTVWPMAALRAALVIGIDDARAPLALANRWLDAVAHDDGRFGYHRRGDFPKGTPALAAAGAWGRVLAGATETPETENARARLLQKNAPSGLGESDRYGWYYATLVLHRHGGDGWGAWRDALGAKLLAAQAADGHWPVSGDRFGREGGRLYTTALSLLALQAPQRFAAR